MSFQKSGTYTPREDEANADQNSDRPNMTGFSPRHLLHQQADAQRAVAEADKWLIARQVNPGRKDSREALEELGFKILREANDLFYEVEPPEGWTKFTEGYFTAVNDETGTRRLIQFFKGAFYDHNAYVSLS